MAYEVLVIGGGASGMAAAIMCARQGIHTAVLESNDRVLKKVLATGNGKCNFSNVDMSASRYNTDFVSYGIDQFGYHDAVKFFESLGMMTVLDEGRAYPYSRQASTVVNALLRGATSLGVDIITGERVTSIDEGFRVTTDKHTYSAQYVILASGSNATTGLMSHDLLRKFGHKCHICTPSLTYLICDKDAVTGLQGIRIKAKATVSVGGKKTTRRGELLFKKDAISGIMVFELSSYFARHVADDDIVTIDMTPDIEEEALETFLEGASGSTLDRLMGVLPKQIAILVDKMARGDLHSAVALIKAYKVHITGVGDIKNAQVVSGGLDVIMFDSHTLESKNVPGLYATGEVMDVDGECGGYNLHWAWASAHLVAQNIGEKYGKR